MLPARTGKNHPALEELKALFEQWRKNRKHRDPIPPSLWNAAFSLSDQYSLHEISTCLRLNYNDLKARTKERSHFIELPAIPSDGCTIEIEKPAGEKMIIRGLYNVRELAREFYHDPDHTRDAYTACRYHRRLQKRNRRSCRDMQNYFTGRPPSAAVSSYSGIKGAGLSNFFFTTARDSGYVRRGCQRYGLSGGLRKDHYILLPPVNSRPLYGTATPIVPLHIWLTFPYT